MLCYKNKENKYITFLPSTHFTNMVVRTITVQERNTTSFTNYKLMNANTSISEYWCMWWGERWSNTRGILQKLYRNYIKDTGLAIAASHQAFLTDVWCYECLAWINIFAYMYCTMLLVIYVVGCQRVYTPIKLSSIDNDNAPNYRPYRILPFPADVGGK